MSQIEDLERQASLLLIVRSLEPRNCRPEVDRSVRCRWSGMAASSNLDTSVPPRRLSRLVNQ